MKIVVAGYPKTGTKTMVAALQKLGYSVYDYMENYEFLKDDWMKIMTIGGDKEDFRRMYKDVDAVTDMPSCYFWQEILEAFPDTKIILTVRDDEATWLESFKGQLRAVQSNEFIASLFLSSTSRDLTRYGAVVYRTLFKSDSVFSNIFTKRLLNSHLCTKSYRMHNSYVQQTAPRDQLLTFNVKEGWEPLCKFLQLPIPDEPFPRKNIKAKVVEDLKTHPVFKKIQIEFCVVGLIVILLSCYCGYRLLSFLLGRLS